MDSTKTTNVLQKLQQYYLINQKIIDLNIIIQGMLKTETGKHCKNLDNNQIEIVENVLKSFTARVIETTEQNLKSEIPSQEELEGRLKIFSLLFNPER